MENVRRIRVIILKCRTDMASKYFIKNFMHYTIMILIIVTFIATLFCLCVVEFEFVVLTAGRKFFLHCRVKLANICHTYGFFVCIRKGKQERNDKIVSLLMWCRNMWGLCSKNKVVRWKVMPNYMLEKLLALLGWVCRIKAAENTQISRG